jgi:FAD:protein FMN transferase
MVTAAWQSDAMKNFRVEFSAMGGANEIVAVAADEAVARAAMEAAAREVLRIEAKYSRFRESVVTAITAAAGTGAWTACDAETNWLLDVAASLYNRSGGLFDITSGVLNKAWNFKTGIVPTADVLAPLLALVGWDKVERGPEGVRLLHSGMALDFGGFGKEYAADRAAAQLKARGIEAGYVNLQGDLAALGPQQDGQAWLIGVQNPRQKDAIIATLPLTRGGLATSGDYEKFFENDGRRYSHILNPKTGYPTHHWSSASVSHLTALQAGVLTTVAMLMEADAEAFLKEQNCSYLLVDLQNQIVSGRHTQRGTE